MIDLQGALERGLMILVELELERLDQVHHESTAAAYDYLDSVLKAVES